MRYIIGMVFAAGGALAMSLLASNSAASWVTRQFTFESPDQVSDVHSAIFMGLNVVGLIIGWAIGFGVGKAIERPDAQDADL
ncbi:MAG: hypothetical protein AAFV45_13065 [Pseudomonadota bacterium]